MYLSYNGFKLVRSSLVFFFPLASRKYDLIHFCQCFRCEYLLRVKGREFVSQIQARFPHLLEQVNFYCPVTLVFPC